MAAGSLIALLLLPRDESFRPPGLAAAGGVVDRDSAFHDVLQHVPSG